MDKNSIARMIDHTLLRPEASEAEITKLCEEALEYNFASVCVNPTYVQICEKILRGSETKVCTVVGFPLGSNSIKTKTYETMNAVENGADEIDMVINIGALKDEMEEFIQKEISEIVHIASGKTVKVIIETALLSDAEIITACRIAKAAGAMFVKTSTGYSTGGATTEHVKLMKDTVGEEVEVKASGGIRTLQDVLEMIESGASRIGTSAGIKIVTEVED